MHRLPVSDEDRKSITEWFRIWGELVGGVNFKAVREMFTEDAIAFGSKVTMVTSREVLERDQWRAIWPTIEDYRNDLSTLHIVVSPDVPVRMTTPTIGPIFAWRGCVVSRLLLKPFVVWRGQSPSAPPIFGGSFARRGSLLACARAPRLRRRTN